MGNWYSRTLLCKLVQPLWKTRAPYLKLCDTAVQFLGVHATEIHSSDHTKTHIRMFMVALFIKAHNWEQSKRPSTVDQIDDCGIFLPSGILHSRDKEQFITTCLHFTNIRLSGRSQTPEPNVLYDSIYIKHVNRQNCSMVIEIWIVVTLVGGSSERSGGALEELVGLLSSFGCCWHESLCFVMICHRAVLCLEHFLLVSCASRMNKNYSLGLCTDVFTTGDVVWWEGNLARCGHLYLVSVGQQDGVFPLGVWMDWSFPAFYFPGRERILLAS